MAAALCVAACTAATMARADNELGLVVEPVRRIGDEVCVTYRVDRPFSPKLEEPLLRGMPATVIFEIGVWKRRAFWFDKLVGAYRSEHRVAFDPWSKTFQIRSGAVLPRTRSAPGLDSLRAVLFHARNLPVASVGTLDSTAAHYVSVKVVIRPLSAEDLDEVEEWLAGSDPDASGDRGLPAYLLEWAANLSGLGERSVLEKSDKFVPAVLSRSPLLERPAR
jgi:hypothetical protein